MTTTADNKWRISNRQLTSWNERKTSSFSLFCSDSDAQRKLRYVIHTAMNEIWRWQIIFGTCDVIRLWSDVSVVCCMLFIGLETCVNDDLCTCTHIRTCDACVCLERYCVVVLCCVFVVVVFNQSRFIRYQSCYVSLVKVINPTPPRQTSVTIHHWCSSEPSIHVCCVCIWCWMPTIKGMFCPITIPMDSRTTCCLSPLYMNKIHK